MKHLKRLFAAIVMTLAIALSASAGDIHLPGESSTQLSAAGNMDFPGVTTSNDALTVLALGLLQNALLLF